MDNRTSWAYNPNWIFSTLFLMCSLIVVSTSQNVEDTIVVCDSYGVTFHKQGILDNAHSVWHQTFEIPLNQEVFPMPDLYCTGLPSETPEHNSPNFQYLCPALKTYKERHVRIEKDIIKAQQNINLLLGNLPSRTK